MGNLIRRNYNQMIGLINQKQS